MMMVMMVMMIAIATARGAVFQEAFRYRHREVPAALVESVATTLQVQPAEAAEVSAARRR